MQKVSKEKNGPLKNWFGFVSCSVFGGLSELPGTFADRINKNEQYSFVGLFLHSFKKSSISICDVFFHRVLPGFLYFFVSVLEIRFCFLVSIFFWFRNKRIEHLDARLWGRESL